MVHHDAQPCGYILITRGRCNRGGPGWVCPPTLKSRGTSYVLVPRPPTFTATFIFIGWSPLHVYIQHRSAIV